MSLESNFKKLVVVPVELVGNLFFGVVQGLWATVSNLFLVLVIVVHMPADPQAF